MKGLTNVKPHIYNKLSFGRKRWKDEAVINF